MMIDGPGDLEHGEKLARGGEYAAAFSIPIAQSEKVKRHVPGLR